MHMFFAAVAKPGHTLGVEDRQRFIDTVRREVVFAAHVQRVVHVAPTPDSIVVGISNQPDGGWHTTWRQQTFVCGYCADEAGLARLDATETLADEASQVAGRFSVLVVDRLRGRFALATQPARIDSVFAAENERFFFFGNQATVLSALRDGAVQYAPDRLLTFVASGFFGDDETPYRGVRCVSSYTTIQVVDGRVTRDRRCLSTLRSRGLRAPAERFLKWIPAAASASLPVIPDRMPDDFIRAFGSLESVPCDLGLTGGMDSRLVIAGAAAAGLSVDCFTRAYGSTNRAEVWVAQRLARVANMPHRTVEVARFNLESDAPPALKLTRTALRTLAATDGMMACQYPVTPVFSFQPIHNLSGAGGEILRGGYGEHMARATKADVTSFMQNLWNHSPRLFHPDLVKEQDDRVQAYVGGFPESVSPGDMLDYLYVDIRCGRWAAASTWASARRIRPLLDNVFIRDTLAIPKRARQHHLVHRQLIERLLPGASDLPLANKFWHGTRAETREALKQKWPEAFTEPKKTVAQAVSKSSLAPDAVAAMKEYVIDSGRLSLFSELLRVDEVRSYLNEPPPNYRHYDRFLQSLFSAAVLLSEPWRDQAVSGAKLSPLGDAHILSSDS